MESRKFANSFLYVLCLFLLCAACAEEEVEPAFIFEEEEGEGALSLSVGAEAGAEALLPFHSLLEWQADVDVDWLTVSPGEGGAGDQVVTVTVAHSNDSGESRKATLTLTSGALVRQIPISQDEYLRLSQDEYEVPAVGGNWEMKFCSSLDLSQLLVEGTGVSWVRDFQLGQSALDSCLLSVNLLPNTGNKSRCDTLRFLKKLANGIPASNGLLATLVLEQPVRRVGESTDYSRDKEVHILQTHIRGDGIPIVLMGDGFIDKEIENGYYESVMERAAENLFTEEPIRTLRDYFDIYAVTAVSAHNSFDHGYSTALGCRLAGDGTTGISGNYDNVVSYVLAVRRVNVDEALAVVVLNTPTYAGTTWSYWYSDTRPRRFSIAYCPVIDDVASENFRRVLVHEAVGHGLAKLDDEYAYENLGEMPDSEIAITRKQQQNFGWWMNVDFTDDPQQVLWSDFLSDSRYADQGLGVFEGACTYWTGAYRSTEESMMRNNIMGFNAPSRRAIYNNVVRRGENRTPDLDEFISFDQQTFVPQTRAAAGAPSRPFARPRVVTLERPLGE